MKEINDKSIETLFSAILALKDKDECSRFFTDLCTISELKSMSQRMEVALMLKKGSVYTDIAEKTGASKVFIMLGMNDVGIYGADGALQAAKELTDNILAITLDVSIYIESTTPIAEGCEIGDLNNETIREFDKLLKGFCEENGYLYLDLYTLFQDEKGYLKSEYCSDSDGMGIHFTDTACNMWADYLKENV